MMKDLLREFYKACGKKKPERIIVYRDGVSEGQFDAVQQQELPQVGVGCTSCEHPDLSCGVLEGSAACSADAVYQQGLRQVATCCYWGTCSK